MNNNFNLKSFLAEGKLLKEDTQVDEAFSSVWDWDITEFGDYNKETNSFYEYGDDSFADYMDTEFPGWLDDEDIADKGSEKYWIDIENAAKVEYGPDVKIYTNSGELIN
jgi:hypothetical protein